MSVRLISNACRRIGLQDLTLSSARPSVVVSSYSTRTGRRLVSFQDPSTTRLHIPWVTAASLLASACIVSYCILDDESPGTTHSLPIAFGPTTTTHLEEAAGESPSSTVSLLNWSGTHAVEVSSNHYWEPDTIEQIENIVRECHAKGQSVRPLGSALSPNGIAFSSHGMMSLAHLDNVVEIDLDRSKVTVQAGARVSQVIEALRPYNLTLPNLASIAEQQMGGFVQVGAHGTGRCIAPVDHYVTSLKLVTPGKGTVMLTPDDGDIFQLAKVGLGCFGIVVEITMQCIPAHRLVEHTFVLTRQQAIEQLDMLLNGHKHMRYMWIPYTDSVVVVTNDPEDASNSSLATQHRASWTAEERFQPLTDLLLELSKEASSDDSSDGLSSPWSSQYTKESMKGMGFGELRDALLAFDPLNVEHVKRCNQAEAEFWKRSEGYQVKPSDQLLQFDCGGQQWVWEVCFPTGTQDANNGNDMRFMQKLLQGIEEHEIPAHSPIEQRWSASSSSLMSPASGPPDGLNSWVGIINYLPSDDERQRREITALFKGRYCDLLRDVGADVNAASHWAKIERPSSLWKLVDLQLFLQKRFPLHHFNSLRSVYDPKNILSGPLLDLLIGKPIK